jgi:putative transposase
MVSDHKLSERHACALVGLSRDAYRNIPSPSALSAELLDKIIETAHTRRRWGYRLFKQEGLAIPKRKKTKRVGVRVPLVQMRTVNQTWSVDLVSDSVAMPSGIARLIMCLTVADDFGHECEDIAVDYGIS